MTFKTFVILMTLATITAWIGWVVVLWAIDPTRAGLAGFAFFYATLALALVGTLTVAGTGIRVWMRPADVVSRLVSTAFRQAFLFTVLVLGSLVLRSHALFRWWTATLLILLLAMVELAFLSMRRPRNLT